MTTLAGIFVGGAGRRMGGLAKGLLRAGDGSTIVERWRRLLDGRGVPAVLVGAGEAYAPLRMEVVHDEPAGIGPLGGLLALLRRAGADAALALACDMPFVSGAIIDRLLTTAPEASILAPRRAGLWEPLCARYDPRRVLPVAASRARSRDHSLQALLDEAGAVELALAPGEEHDLRDWDAPEDVV